MGVDIQWFIASSVERGVRDSSVFSCFVLSLFVFVNKHFYLNLIHPIKQAEKVNQLRCLYLIIALILLNQVCSCKYDEFQVEDVFHNVSCLPCPSCPPGYGLTPQCGSFIKYGAKVECQPCELGTTYSATYDISSCHPCGICSDHQKVIRNCTLESNSKCNQSCSSGFYYEEMTGDCRACSWCCNDGRNTVKDQCKDMPYYKQCDANEIDCQPKCRDDQYLVVTRTGTYCKKCKSCTPGFSLFPQCGSIVENTNDIRCVKCIAGITFSEQPGKKSCKACSTCSVGQKELTPCNMTHDRVCGECNNGFYNANGTECKPCSACCNDDQDVHVTECVAQNMPKNKQCSFTQRAVNVCQQKNANTDTTIIQRDSPALFILMIALGVITAVTVLAIWKYVKYRTHTRLLRSQSLAALLPSEQEGEVTCLPLR